MAKSDQNENENWSEGRNRLNKCQSHDVITMSRYRYGWNNGISM